MPFAVNHVDGTSTQHAEPLPGHSYFTFMAVHFDVGIREVFVDNHSMVGRVVLNTACQRTCCGKDWCDMELQRLRQHLLQPRCLDISKAFQFRPPALCRPGSELTCLPSWGRRSCCWLLVSWTRAFRSWLPIRCLTHCRPSSISHSSPSRSWLLECPCPLRKLLDISLFPSLINFH